MIRCNLIINIYVCVCVGVCVYIYIYKLQSFFKILFLFICRERGREGESKEEKDQCVVASHTPPVGDLVHNPGMYPDWELNQQLFASQAGAQTTEIHQPGPEF